MSCGQGPTPADRAPPEACGGKSVQESAVQNGDLQLAAHRLSRDAWGLVARTRTRDLVCAGRSDSGPRHPALDSFSVDDMPAGLQALRAFSHLVSPFGSSRPDLPSGRLFDLSEPRSPSLPVSWRISGASSEIRRTWRKSAAFKRSAAASSSSVAWTPALRGQRRWSSKR